MAQADIAGPYAQSYGTEPPAVARPTLKRRVGEAMSAVLMPLIKRAARPYLGGELIEDALFVSDKLSREGFATSLSYWDGGQECLNTIEATAAAAITALSAVTTGQYLALKPPALRFSEQVAVRLARLAQTHGVRLHFDSHGPEVTDQQNAMLTAMRAVAPSHLLGTTLPGRHRRSLEDAEWAVAAGLNLRVVKGEWPDPADPKRDAREGFLAIIDRLAGRARHVAVATHELALAREAISRLREAGTSCEVEVLLGMPAEPLLAWAKSEGVTVRVYVPYGCGFIPNAVGVLRRNPRLALAVARAQLRHLTSRA